MIASNLHKVKAEIAEICLKNGRNPESVTLIAVSKLHTPDAIRQAVTAGQTDFGENYAQEFRDKFNLFGNSVRWHFIGHLQSNKVKYVAGKALLVHTLDSMRLANEINAVAGKANSVQDVLIEVKTSGEAAKKGITGKETVFSLVEACRTLPYVRVTGLMTMAPLTADTSLIRSCFSGLRQLFEELNRSGEGLTELSMGMSNDFTLAIEEGATLLRIGTAIFGERILETV